MIIMPTCEIILLTCVINYAVCQPNHGASWIVDLVFRGKKYAINFSKRKMQFKNIAVKTVRILASQRNLGPLSNGDILTRVSISVDVEIFCCYVMLTFSEQINKKIGYQHLKPQGKGVGVGNFQSCYIPATYFFIRLKKRRTIFQFKFMLPFFYINKKGWFSQNCYSGLKSLQCHFLPKRFYIYMCIWIMVYQRMDIPFRIYKWTKKFYISLINKK